MQGSLRLESNFVLSEASLPLNSNGKMDIPLYNSFSLINPSSFFAPSNLFILNRHSLLSFSLWNQTQIQNSIKYRRNNRRRIGYQRSRKLILQSIYFVASNLNILPEPLALAIRQFGGGNGGGFGFWKGFGGEGFDGWRGKRKNKLGFFGFVMACGLGMWLIRGKELDREVFLGVLAFSLLGVSYNGWKRGFKDWVLGFCFCAVLVGLGLRRENLQRWAKGLGPMETLSSRKRRRAMCGKW
ncbi:hypothetical protein U1Q18_004206 [Sarracenia purpurea var. burkii]